MASEPESIVGSRRKPSKRTSMLKVFAVAASALTVAGLLLLQQNRQPDKAEQRQPVAEADAQQGGATPAPKPLNEYLDLNSLLVTFSTSVDHNRLIWDAREVVVAQCMSRNGYKWLPRPNNDSVTEWGAWQKWYDPIAATDPSFEAALFGVEGEGSTNVGGCQLTAYQALHEAGITVEERMADLYNEAAGVALAVDGTDPELQAREVDALLTEWLASKAGVIEELQRAVEAEAAKAKEVLQEA